MESKKYTRYEHLQQYLVDTVVNVRTMWLTFFQIQLTKGKEGELQTFPTFGCQVFSQKNPLLNWFTNTGD